MTEDRMTMLFFEMFSGLPRQGPGDAASTLRALALVPGVGPESRVLDLGCGTGLQTRVLAQSSPARFIAVDNHAPFVDVLNHEARHLGIADRLEARVGDMRRLDVAPGSFDLVWCEGAIAIMGVEAGLRDWRRLLAPGGHMAMTEVCWMKPDPPPECATFWANAVPGDPRRVDAPRAHRRMRVRNAGSLRLTTVGLVGRLLPPASGECDRVSQPSPRSA